MGKVLVYNKENAKKRTLLGVELPKIFSTASKNGKKDVFSKKIRKGGFKGEKGEK